MAGAVDIWYVGVNFLWLLLSI